VHSLNVLSTICALASLGVAGLASSPAIAKKLTIEEIHRMKDAHHRIRREIERWDSPLPPGDPLAIYENEFRRAIPLSKPKPAKSSELSTSLGEAPFVFLGDDHGNPRAQQNAIRVMKSMANRNDSEHPLTLVIEWIDSKFQPVIDDYLAGKLTLDEVRTKAEYDAHWDFDWKRYSNVLSSARSLGVHVLAAETDRAQHELGERDAGIERTLIKHRNTHGNSRYLVMYGEDHLLGERHLAGRMAQHGFEPQLFVLQKLTPQFYWNTLHDIRDTNKMSLLRLNKQTYFLDTGTPLETDYQYLKELSGLAGNRENAIAMGRGLGLEPEGCLAGMLTNH
jgi:hypothetical protein